MQKVQIDNLIFNFVSFKINIKRMLYVCYFIQKVIRKKIEL